MGRDARLLHGLSPFRALNSLSCSAPSIVVFLSSYSDLYGASFGYLKKVERFRSIFTRRDIGSHAVHTLRKGDLGALSHQVPARMVSKGEASMLLPGGT